MGKQFIGVSLVLGALSYALLPVSFARSQDGGRPAESVARSGEEIERSDPFLWRVERGDATAYLFGTVHLPDERVLALPDPVEEAFQEATAFYAEIEATPETEAEIQRRAMLPDSTSLPDIIGEGLWKRVEGELRRAGLGGLVIPGWKRMRPWAIGATLPMLDYLEAQLKGIKPLDAELFERARDAGKRTAGLETVEEQLSVFESFSDAEQTRMLRHTLDQLEEDRAAGVSTIEETVRAWLSGEEDALLDVLEDSFAIDPDLRERMEARLIWERNVRFAVRIEAAIADAPEDVAFFAVGALHMPDPRPIEDADTDLTQREDAAPRQGLVSLLRERGFTVTRVRAAAPAGAGR